MKLRDDLNMFYIHLQKTNGHQTRQGAELQWEATIIMLLFLHSTTECL